MTSVSSASSDLARVVGDHRAAVIAKREEVQADRAARVNPGLDGYVWAQTEARLAQVVRDATGIDEVMLQLDLIDRAKFGGDIALKVPSLLKHGGPKRFIAEFQPAISEILQSERMADMVEAIELKGMYINITLTNAWLLGSAGQVVAMGDQFGLNDTMAGQNVVVDYSSPNVAKVLHAGHIRSTITGEVLSNVYDACGATVYRVNHINDFGGFGFLLEGYRRFHDAMPEGSTENQRLLAVYTIRRSMERIVETGAAKADWPAEDRAVVDTYFPGVEDAEGAKAAFAEFTAASDARFQALENGDAEEVALWEKMVEWSLADFQSFYRLLNIDIDFVIGESFYFQDGLDVIAEAIKAGTASVYTREEADAALAEVDRLHAAGEISDGEAEFRKLSIEKDCGSTVVHLPGGERFVLLRSDGRSIYATRDIGAIHRRNELFNPDHIVYVVGQEQRSHFERLFAAAEVLGMVKDGKPDLTHLYFGFYVDAETGKKLSSRASVSNVMALLDQAEKYFHGRLSEREGADADGAARQLTVGSLVFNDLKQDIKGSVDIDVSSLENTILGFERAGGAYAVYTACRARSILRRYGSEPKTVEQIGAFELNAQEAKLLLMLQQTPQKVAEAARRANPTYLLRHLLDIAMEYNSYYTVAPVLGDDGANESRVLITKAVQLVLVNGLAICHIDTPESI